MALHSELPIYKVSYDLAAMAVKLIPEMPRDLKHSIGMVLRDECIAISVLIFRANVSTDKVPHLTTLIERLQVAELLLRLARDLRCISIPQYAAAIKLTDNIGRQAGGWRKKATSPVASRSRP